MAEELPTYLAAANAVVMANEEDKVAWWAAHIDAPPNWAALVKRFLVIQPSSASSEKAFSLLNNSFNLRKTQLLALEDYLEAYFMIRCNGAKRL